MGDVVNFNGTTRLDIPPERVLRAAQEHDFEGVVVIGCTKEGEFYFASSWAASADVVWRLRRAEHHLMQIADEDGS